MEKKNKFYVTTSIAYANSVPHIGYALEVVQADVIARYHALKIGKENVFFLSGTDEHGSKIKKTAAEKGMEVKDFVDTNAQRFKDLLQTLNISNNAFIRTTDEKHKTGAQKLWMKLVEAGDIYEKTYEGKYCVGCEAFLTERDLVDGKCPYHLKEPEAISEKNYFFRVSKYLPEIKKRIESGELDILPESRKHEILNLIDSADKENMDVSFSRPKSVVDWGVPVPNDEDHVMYVWCDALANYISALGYADCDEDSPLERGKGCVNFEKFWPADVHVVGKDILRFHAMLWPAMLLSAGLPLPKKVCVHGFITSGGQKMSKSLGNIIDPFAVIEKYGVDPVRYFLLKEISTTEDGDFSYERFEEVYKSDLQNGLGNLVARVLAMIEKYFDGKIPAFDERYKDEVSVSQSVTGDMQGMEKEYEGKDLDLKILQDRAINKRLGHFDNFELDLALKDADELVSILDKYIQHYEPFKLIKENKEKTGCVLYKCLETIFVINDLIEPFLPETSQKISEQCGEIFAVGAKIHKGEGLFPRLENQL